MAVQVDYNMTVDLVNPNNNVSSDYPLVQGSLVNVYLTVLENGNPVTIDDIDNVNIVVACYCKLDNAPVILPIEKTELSLASNGEVFIASGENITSHAGKCALILKYTNGYTTYSTPLYYYVNANPMAGVQILPPIVQL